MWKLVESTWCAALAAAGAATPRTNNYNFNKRVLQNFCSIELSSLVVVMGVVELWKAAQLLDTGQVGVEV
jgi:hypothetical protein